MSYCEARGKPQPNEGQMYRCDSIATYDTYAVLLKGSEYDPVDRAYVSVVPACPKHAQLVLAMDKFIVVDMVTRQVMEQAHTLH